LKEEGISYLFLKVNIPYYTEYKSNFMLK